MFAKNVNISPFSTKYKNEILLIILCSQWLLEDTVFFKRDRSLASKAAGKNERAADKRHVDRQNESKQKRYNITGRESRHEEVSKFYSKFVRNELYFEKHSLNIAEKCLQRFPQISGGRHL
jgi:hypothetical protein